MYACLDPSKNSRILATNLVTALDGVSPIYEPKAFFEAGTRYINGHPLCDAVGLGKPGLYCTFIHFPLLSLLLRPLFFSWWKVLLYVINHREVHTYLVG